MADFAAVQLRLLGGETDVRVGPAGRITSNSHGWLPDNRGFLRTYTGLQRILLPQKGGTGPLEWAGKWVKGRAEFVDQWGRQRQVLVVGDGIYTLDGIDPTLIFTYPTPGRVELIVHQNHVIFLNPHHPPVKWDGEALTWLGVRDIPQAPRIRKTQLDSSDIYFSSYDSWGASALNYRPPVGPQHDDSLEQETRGWWWKLAFMNSRGQVGRWGAASFEYLESTGGTVPDRRWLTVEWQRPSDAGPANLGSDITYAVLARTGNTWTDPEAGAFFIQDIYPITQNHSTDNHSDAALADAITEDNFPPVNASFGCVYKDIVLISGNLDDPYGVWHSKPGFMEAWPELNYYKARDVVTAVLPLSDRVVIVTESGIEVIVLTDTGNFALFRKEDGKGSVYGRSLVVYKDSIFGIWNSGYGIFDGFAFKGQVDVYGELFDYIDPRMTLQGVLDRHGNYWCLAGYRSDDTGSGASHVIHYSFAFNAWFRVKETGISSLWIDGDDIVVGGDGNIYIFDGGGYDGWSTRPPFDAVLEVAPTGLEADDRRAGIFHKSLVDLYALVSSTCNADYKVEVFADEDLVEAVARGYMPARLSKPGFKEVNLDSLWDVAVLDEGAAWDAPRSIWSKVVRWNNVAQFYSARIRLTLDREYYGEIFALNAKYRVEAPQPGV